MSKPRRASGEGALYQRKSDKRWVGSFPVVKEGKKTRKYVYGDTKGEAREKLKKAQRAYEQRQLITGKQPTLAQYLTFWLEVRHDFKPSTAHSFRQRIEHYILPHLGHLRLDQLTPDVIASWVTTLFKRGGAKGQGLATNTVRYVFGILKNALNEAVRWEKIASNPMSRVKQPRYEEYDGEVLTIEQAGQLLRVARDSRLECLLTIALITGMRKGEVLGLQWRDVDFEAKMLTISHTLYYGPDRQTKNYRHILVEPKSKASRRPIVLPEIILESLRIHRTRQLEQKMKARDKWHNLDLVFCNQEGNYYVISHLRVQFKRLLAKAGLPNIRFHDLRHSAATILLKMGVHPKVVQELLGHSNIAITLRVYSKVLPSIHRETMDALNVAFQKQMKDASGKLSG